MRAGANIAFDAGEKTSYRRRARIARLCDAEDMLSNRGLSALAFVPSQSPDFRNRHTAIVDAHELILDKALQCFIHTLARQSSSGGHQKKRPAMGRLQTFNGYGKGARLAARREAALLVSLVLTRS